MEGLTNTFYAMESAVQSALAGAGIVSDVVTFVTRFIFPVLALLVFFRCLWPLMSGGRKTVPWAQLVLPGGVLMPLSHWENSIGRSETCDVVIALPHISRIHAVITRKKNQWFITDLNSKGGVKVNGEECEGMTPIHDGDIIKLAGLAMTIIPAVKNPDEAPAKRTFAVRMAEFAKEFRPGTTLLYILLFQFLGLLNVSLARGAEFSMIIPLVFMLFMGLECVYYVVTRGSGRRHIEPELLAFFLSGIGMFVCATADPVTMFKQFMAVVLGLVLFIVLTYFLNNIERARRARYVFAIGAVLLLGVNLVLAQTVFGAKNWISIAGISLQPSELVKVAFVFAGGATLDRLLTSRNFLRFLVFSGVCIGAMVIMRDFGAALIFYTGFLVITFMRSGDVRKLGLITGVTAAGALIVVAFLPYITARFAAWRHVWEFLYTTGYQQTRTMIYTASGGMFGVGPGNGYLRYVAAADTDLVFGLVAEEWGLIIALVCALAPLALAVFSAVSVKASRSSFYAIVACGAASMMLIQTALNVFGSMDILPLTGVTLPFVSNGGSSMLSCWGLLACIKSIDERHRAREIE